MLWLLRDRHQESQHITAASSRRDATLVVVTIVVHLMVAQVQETKQAIMIVQWINDVLSTA